MFRQLIDDLRLRNPRYRAELDLRQLLGQNAQAWPGRETLLSRPGHYTRTRVYRDANFELLLLNWAPSAASAIHDHGGQHCWMIVLDGILDVDDYVRLDSGETPGIAEVRLRDSRRMYAGDLDLRSGRFDLHRVSAPVDTSAVSLHLYAGPLQEYLVYDAPARRCDRAYGMYDAIVLDDRVVARKEFAAAGGA